MEDPQAQDPFQRVYAESADRYEALVAREDAAGRLLPALEALAPLAGARVVEFGAGTGRLTRLLAPRVRELRAFEGAPAMAALGRTLLAPWPHVTLEVADHARVPAPGGWADVAVEGWAFGHAVAWHPEAWPAVVASHLDEMDRVLRRGGTAILVETLGTGCAEPRPPEALEPFFGLLEARGFTRSWVRTDYRFASREEADDLTTFFFRRTFPLEPDGDGVRLPECTGLWHRVRT